MATTSAAVRELDDGNSQGTRLGRNTASLISFYGATPIAQRAAIATSTLTVSSMLATSDAAAVSTGGANNITTWAFSSAAQANAVITGVNQLRTDLTALKAVVDAWRTSMTTTGLFSGS